MKRRDFLKNSASLMALGSLSQLAPSLSWALTTQDQFLLTVFLDGGADVSLGLDPWTKEQRPDSNDYFIEYTSNDLIKVGDVVYGPALSGMTNVLSDFSVVRGIFLSENDNGHPPAEAMMRSGNGSNKYPDLAIEFASMHDDDDSFGVATSQLLNQLDRTVSQIDINGLGAMTPITDSNKGFQGSGAVNRARMELLRKSAQINKFVSLRNQIKGDDEKKTLTASIAAGFSTGMMRSASIQLPETYSLDTHANHEGTHLNLQRGHWEALAKLVEVLKSTPTADGTSSVFDKTTIVAFSEFSRTPALNTAKGKDHNPLTNSVLVSGPGFKKGVGIGGSRIVSRRTSQTGLSYHVALPCDLNTGRLITRSEDFNTGDIITPEIVMATIADSLNLNRNMFGCAKKSTKSIRSILK